MMVFFRSAYYRYHTLPVERLAKPNLYDMLVYLSTPSKRYYNILYRRTFA